ncbi:MAG: Si-specific NAD(P)(+) transhydrogenase [Phycisphaeraceae bacterium]|nr:Si-specific NAD(P)(+) transhydrogenase [Phycisphaeraceae bacterium]
MRHFDLAVLGAGPAGSKAAIQAAKLGKSVCLVEKQRVVGGAAINTGTIPSKSLREAILSYTSVERLPVYRDPFRASADPDRNGRASRFDHLTAFCAKVIAAEVDVLSRHLIANEITVLNGRGSFESANTLGVTNDDGRTEMVTADKIIIATGTRPARPDHIPFDDRNIVDSDTLLKLPSVPRSLIVVGGGVIGTEYASMMSRLGVRTTLIEGRDRVLEFLDDEIGEALQYTLRQGGMTLRLGEKVVKIRVMDPPEGTRVNIDKLAEITLESGKTLHADCVLYAVGRQGNTDKLNLVAAGLSADSRGRIEVNDRYQTSVENIYAVGDVIGFPALASTSMEQGRLCASMMFGKRVKSTPRLFPYGIYAIPEVSMVGWTEQQLTEEGIPYEAGIAHYREIARAQMMGDETGMLKMLVHQESRTVLGVHTIGMGATELIHIGQAAMAFNATVDYFVDAVFNYPTLAECYKVAAFNAVNKLASVV